MILLKTNDGCPYYSSLEDCKKDGYSIVKCWNTLQFYQLPERKSIITIDSMEPIPGLHYVIKPKNKDIYFLKEFRLYPIRELFFYYQHTEGKEINESIETLRTYVAEGMINLLFTEDQITDIRNMLQRICRTRYPYNTLSYRRYIDLLEQTLRYEDYKDYGKNLVGFKTVCLRYEEIIKQCWEKALKNHSLA
jgi:hypothetical protein